MSSSASFASPRFQTGIIKTSGRITWCAKCLYSKSHTVSVASYPFFQVKPSHRILRRLKERAHPFLFLLRRGVTFLSVCKLVCFWTFIFIILNDSFLRLNESSSFGLPFAFKCLLLIFYLSAFGFLKLSGCLVLLLFF